MSKGKAPFSLPDLPWARDALEPVISERTIDFHYGKHHQGYVNKLNKAVEGTNLAEFPLLEIIQQTHGDAARQGVFNNAAQVWNHTFYWHSLSPDGGQPEGELAARLDADFGGLAGFNDAMVSAAAGQFGSGWAWLIVNDGKLDIVTTSNADTPITDGHRPLLTIDVWEHAYYLDHQNDRRAYLKQVVDKLLNWSGAHGTYEEIRNA